MVLRWVVNAGLLAIPIGGTVGALMGIDAHRHATGQAPLFSGGGGGSSGSGSGGSGSPTHNGLENIVRCQESYGIKPETKGQSFTCTLLRVLIGFRMTDRYRSKSQSMGCDRRYNRSNMHERKC
jgi:hypothetical protein